MQVSPRALDVSDNNGWVEWAIVYQEEQTQLMGATSLGVQTLMDTANKQYRANCILTGCFPIGINQANSQDLKIKIPPKYQKIKIGGILIMFAYFRSNNSADVRTTSHRFVASSIFKCYT